MSEEATRKPVALPIWVGGGLTIGLALFIGYLASINRCVLLETSALECRRNYQWFLDASPNEIGDTIAGVFATLAFVWVVVTVFLQSAELAEQRKELQLTRAELELARIAQEAQLTVMQKQADIFEDEKRRRDQLEAKNLYDQYLIDVGRMLNHLGEQQMIWRIPSIEPRSEWDDGKSFDLFVAVREREMDERAINSYSVKLRNKWSDLNSYLQGNPGVIPVAKNYVIGKLIEKLNSVINLDGALSDADLQRVKRMRASALLDLVRQIDEDSRLWVSEDQGAI